MKKWDNATQVGQVLAPHKIKSVVKMLPVLFLPAINRHRLSASPVGWFIRWSVENGVTENTFVNPGGPGGGVNSY